MDFFHATNGPSWTNTSGWLGGSSYCAWHGVYCGLGGGPRDDKRVTALSLSSNRLSGTIPSSIGTLIDIWNLVLSGWTSTTNKIEGTLPSSMNNLVNMTLIHITHNRLSGTIPSLANLQKLSELDLNHNMLSGEIGFKPFYNMVSLDLANNKLSGSVDRLLSHHNLMSLYLNNNQLSGTISSLAYPGRLTRLDLGHNQLSGNLPAPLFNYSFYNVLKIDGNSFSGVLPSTVCSLKTPWSKFQPGYCNMSGNAFACPLPACPEIVADQCGATCS
jgi:Leucine-rich repeat (LRR) protein